MKKAEKVFNKILELADGEIKTIISDSKETIIDTADTIEDANSLFELLEEAINEASEVIYYAKAIKFLAEHDASLTESLAIAHELGYELKNLNSEILASLLNRQILQEDFFDCFSELETELLGIEEDEDEE